MANNDGDVRIGTQIDTSGIEEGVGKITNTLNKIADNKTLTAFSKLGNAVTGVKNAFSMATTAINTAKKAVNECTQAYKTQIKAEVQLEAAAKNNPYLDSNSIKNLKNYASELQSISTYGDEQLLPFMAQLASTGRTQSEVMDIMSAAVDVASSGIMTLDEAVTNLNRTYSGQIGRLGMTIPQVKNLTEEQLKNGEATRIVAEQFKGMAKTVTEATGSADQLKNAIGDWKEEMGAPFEKAMSPMRKYFTELISGWASAKRAKREYEEIEDRTNNNTGNISDYETRLAQETKILEEKAENYLKAVDILSKTDKEIKKTDEYTIFTTWSESSNPLADFKKQQQEYIDGYKKQQEVVESFTKKLEEQKKQEEELARVAKEEADIKAQQESEKAANDKAAAAKKNYILAVQSAQEEIELRKKLGENITEEQEAQEMLNVRMSAYIKMIEEAEGTISGNKGFAKEEADKIAAESKRIYELNNPGEDPNNKSIEIVKQWETQKNLTLQQQLEMLDNYSSYLSQKENKTKEEIEMEERLKTAKENINKQIEQNQKDHIANTMAAINDYITEFSDITKDMTALVRSSNEAETEQELTDLSKQYSDGIITYEEYCEKKKAINRKAAQEEYKLKMWEWTASLLTATANVAQGVSKAIADNGMPAGAILGALAAAAGAVQIASITANKPTPPKFATGGIVPGSSYSGDRVPAMLNSREMVLNMGQQQRLFDIANGAVANGGTTLNMPVTINNNTGANVSTKLDKNGLTIMVDEMVNSSMQAGRYTQSMNIAESRSKGASYF